MRWPFGNLQSRLVVFTAVPLLGILIGVAVAIATNPTSFMRPRGDGAYTGAVEPSPSPADSTPLPSVTSPGVLGDSARLLAGSSGVLIGLGPSLIEESSDGGKTWTALQPPTGASGIAVDPTNPQYAITGGSSIQVTANGGASWKATRTSPPGIRQYQPLQVSPFTNTVWFLMHQQSLLRTRDAAVSWRELAGLPPLANPVMAPGTVVGQFFLVTGNRVFELIDNGQRILELPHLPEGVTVSQLAVVAADPPSLLARGGQNGAYLLKGNTWSVVGGGLNGPVGVGSGGTLLVGNGGDKLGVAGAISYSTDGGSTWGSGIGLPYDQSVEAITQGNPTTLFAYCYGGDIYSSTDSGRSWMLVSRGLRTTTG